MAEDKKGFLLYLDYWEFMKKLSNDQIGQLMKCIFEYEKNLEVPEIDDLAVDIAFTQIKNNLDRNRVEYAKTVEKRRKAAQKRWEQKEKAITQDVGSAETEQAMHVHNLHKGASTCNANDADNDTDNDTDIENGNGNEKGNDNDIRNSVPLGELFEMPKNGLAFTYTEFAIMWPPGKDNYKHGLTPAREIWPQFVTDENRMDLKQATQNYLETEMVKKGMVMSAEKFVRGAWRDYLRPEKPPPKKTAVDRAREQASRIKKEMTNGSR